MPDQIPEVGSNAKVVDFADVDGDPHSVPASKISDAGIGRKGKVLPCPRAVPTISA
jgi:hypothetical protein